MAVETLEKEDPITELTALEATSVSGVGSPANGTPFLLLKATEHPASFSTGKRGKARKGAKARKGESESMEVVVTGEGEGDADVTKADERVEKSPGVPAASVATPTEAGHIPDTGTSGKRVEPMTGAVVRPHESPAFSLGGESHYEIPTESRVDTSPDISMMLNRAQESAIHKALVYGVDSLADAIDKIAADRKAANQPWNTTVSKEAIDAALDTLALAVLEKSHVPGHDDGDDPEPDDDADDARKAGRRLSRKTTAALVAARDHLNSLLTAGHEAGHTGPNIIHTQEDSIVTELSKEEVTTLISKASAEAVQTALKAERKAAKKVAKQEAKLKAKTAKESANNKGDISEGEMRGDVHGTHEANDVNAVKQNKPGKAAKAVATGFTNIEAAMKSLEEKVSKIASRPQRGGPLLTGQIPQEGRLAEPVAKAGESEEIQKLAKSLEAEQDKRGPEAAARASELSQQLTLARLRAAHEAGLI